ncbi:response regulator [Chryseolinea lacunae]|uniref:Response regulator n=1 Tax=Chryseolinea lacunae TaxID=2801331 RepID=A0ABS1L2P0_9BACT|nr:response regulator [Chryseolinea lacunae]MBL0745835.1 response regulator [Chryseolinea lacunae]
MHPNKNIKVFLVDDDAFNLTLTQQQLLNLGYANVAAFENGTDCLNNLAEKPEVVFLDHTMEGVTGFDVLKKIRRVNPDIFVVMLSAQENMNTAIDSLKYGAFDYIIKGPQQGNKIENALERITEIMVVLKKTKLPAWRRLLSFI